MTLDLQAAYDEALGEAITSEIDRNGVQPHEWYVSGRASKAWPNKEDEAWWRHNGPEMLEHYVAWRREHQMRIWETPQGVPAIELDLTTEAFNKFSGGRVPLPGLRAIIDRIFVTDNGEVVIVDLKSGKRLPIRQLGFYKVAVEAIFDIRVSLGAFWDARKGHMTDLIDLSYFTAPVVGKLIEDYVRSVGLGINTPIPSNMCSSCTVRDFCAEYGGKRADEIAPF